MKKGLGLKILKKCNDYKKQNKDFTQEKLAKEIGLTPKTFRENMKKDIIDIYKLVKLSELLEFDLLEFLQEHFYKEMPREKIFLAVEVNKNDLKNSNLPDNIIKLIKEK